VTEKVKATQSQRDSMSSVKWEEVNYIYGNTPTFMGAKPVREEGDLAGLDVVFAGLPWEWTNTWGSYSSCEMTPKAVRNASLRYGTGYVPEYDIEVMKHIQMGDYGDFATFPNDVEKTHQSFYEGAAAIFRQNVVPVFFGGDHSVTNPVIRALSEAHPKKVGIIHFDAHLDNSDEFEGDPYARCAPLRRIAELPGMDPKKMVHIGIHGPRNSPKQMQFVKDSGIPIYTMKDIREQGLEKVIQAAQQITSEGTDGYYVTICSDIIDKAFNPGGPNDFGGLTSGEMLTTLVTLGKGKMLGIDIVEIYPKIDPNEESIHLGVWLAIYALAGMAMKKMGK